jgi:N-formylglutamate deformylase
MFHYSPGSAPLIVSLPHVGTTVPDEFKERMTAEGRAVADTDWYVDRLYEEAPGLGAAMLRAEHSRYVVDLNRDPSGQPLYPGADNTEVCPTRTFDNKPIWLIGQTPDAGEIEARIERHWRPYHRQLGAALEEMRQRHGLAVLVDGHSIRSMVPRFFQGRLPDLNFGTAGGASADRRLTHFIFEGLEAAKGYTAVRDGRFTGGYITRNYGRPKVGVHAVQLEIAQLTYMEEKPPFRYRPDLARNLKPVLRRMLETALEWAAAAKARQQAG